MTDKPGEPAILYPIFRFIIRMRWWVAGVYLLLLGPSIYYALKVAQDNSIDRLIVQSDPDYITARGFEKVFGSGEYVVVLLEAEDPFSKDVLARVDELEGRLAALPGVTTSSALSVFRRARAGFQATEEQAQAFRKFATGTDIFRKQGLFGERFLAIPLVLSVKGSASRAQVLAAIDGVLAEVEERPAPLVAVHKVGQPYVNAYLDTQTRSQGMRYFPLFGLFVVVLCISLYRSFRALIAFIIALGTSAALSVGYIGVTGGIFTIVSSVVPMTILIVCTATLVYLHSRFVECPEDADVDEHQVYALVNKFLACTASIFATAVGFAALAVSKIRPIREMGLWVAVGLLFTWLVVFTLFPALQRILRTPTRHERRVAGQSFLWLLDHLPIFSYRYRYLLVSASLILCAVGVVALFGIPGHIDRMDLETNAVEYINHDSKLYKDTKALEKVIPGLSMTEVWLTGPQGSLSQPRVVRALSHFEQALARDPSIGAVVGLPTILRTFRYIAGKGDELPEDEETLERITDDLETLVPREPMLLRFVEQHNFADTHISVITKTLDYDGFVRLKADIVRRFAEAQKRDEALRPFKLRMAGLAALEAKISYHLVPTLVESFGLTVVIIFGTFLLLFRNGAARLMAMIPSLFAILVMFALMRLFGMNLNVATILIASTVLGTSENDQIHFFYHFLEGRREGSTEKALRHTLLISGRAIFFATMINAGGFLAFALADLPPIRHFGILSALAFLLSMLADFTALLSALWMVFRDKPDSLK